MTRLFAVAVVASRRRFRGKDAEGTFDPAIVRTEIVAPVGDAVRFVDDDERYAIGELRQHLDIEPLVGKAFRRDQDDIHLVTAYRRLYFTPTPLIVGIDGLRSHAHPLRGRDLVAHERQQWADQQRRSHTGLAQQLGRDEVDEALPPPCLLHHQQPPVALEDVADRLFLPRPEPRPRVAHPGAQQRQGPCRGESLRCLFHDPRGAVRSTCRLPSPGRLTDRNPSTMVDGASLFRQYMPPG